MNNWLSLNKEQQINLFNQAAAITGLRAFTIEKDAWVTLVLRMLFTSDLYPHIVFKGGTSLSKVYGLIERFSEDIDLSIDRKYLGFEGELSSGMIRKLRRSSHDFSAKILPNILKGQLTKYGVDNNVYEITVPNTKISDQDPEAVFVNYESVFKEERYLLDPVKIEIGARSLNEPFNETNIDSIIDANFNNVAFTEEPFRIKAIAPEKTFLEKMILLHEEFKKPEDKVRYKRMSRHLYDIHQIAQTDYGKRALKDADLFRHICNHRAVFTPIRQVNYDELSIENLEFTPPEKFMKLYQADYEEMRTAMIYGNSLPFDEMIKKLRNIKP